MNGVYYLNAVDDIKQMEECKDGCVYFKESLFPVREEDILCCFLKNTLRKF